MAAAHAPGDRPTTQRVDKALLDAARHRAGLEASADAEPWTACLAPGLVRVIDADGGARHCEYATLPDNQAGAAAPTAEHLRASLRDAQLPLPHCTGCANLCAEDAFASAPMLRDYGTLADTPGIAVLRLAHDGSNRRFETDLRDLLEELREAETILVDGRDVFASETLPSLLRHLGEHGAHPRIVVRTEALGAEHGRDELFNAVAAIELVVRDAKPAPVAMLAEQARRLDATPTLRFLLTPNTWFDFEPLIEIADGAGVPVDLRVLDRDGVVPLEALGPEDLTLLLGAVLDHWSHLTGDQRPECLADDAFDNLCRELRALIGRRLTAPQGSTNLELPGLDHPWHAASDRVPPWHTRLFGAGARATVREWVLRVGDEQTLEQHPWLRALAHRVCREAQPPELLTTLRRLYGNRRRHHSLLQQDEETSRRYDLQRFGGPWHERIGLGPRKRRSRPFRIQRATPSATTTTPLVTVLIPSYKHAGFIGETIRSVLAQRDEPFRVLVADDRSPDRTVDKARAIADERVTVRVNDKNLGLGNSVLEALGSIDTPYVALLNSDDLLHPDHLATCRRAIEENPRAKLVCTDVQPIDAKGGRLTPDNVSLVLDGKQVFEWIHWFDRNRAPKDLPPERAFDALLERNYLVTSSNLFARTDWLREQASSLKSLKYCLDWRLFLQASAEGALVHVREPLIAYRLHSSNTVWFEDQRRYTYYLEVNRVVAEALAQFGSGDGNERIVERIIDAVAEHVRRNSETDGFAMFLNALLDTLTLERVANESPRAKELLSRLSDASRARHSGTTDKDTRSDELIAAHLRSVAEAERGQKRWLQVYSDGLQTRLREADNKIRKIWQEKQRLEEARQELDAKLKRSEQQLTEADRRASQVQRRLGRLEQELRDTDSRREQAQRERDRIESDLEKSRRDNDATQRALNQVLERLATKLREAEEQRMATDAIGAELQTTREALARSIRQAEEAHSELAGAKRQAAARQEELAALRQRKAAELREANQQLARTRSRLDQVQRELAQTLRGREFQIGNFLWNRLPVAAATRPVKRWYRKLIDARTRSGLRRSTAGSELGRAIVATTTSWPVSSHTFAYQEIKGLIEAGLDVRILHWHHDRSVPMHAAFLPLVDRQVTIQPLWSAFEKDRAWFERTRPDAFRSFLARVGELTGKTPKELREAPIVQRACTFARLTELSGARYVHSYFFYDMSFMAMMAAWLLDLPRGITCYADHMLQDSPWKLVALHIETCDLVVATSERIKAELSDMTDGRWDDKILVKPNGVDGRRFPAIERQPRRADEPLELLSLCRIEPKKGLLHLVDAIAMLRERRRPVRVHVVGAGDAISPGSIEYAERFHRKIQAHGLEAEFVLHGNLRQEALTPLLQQCRVFVAPYVELENGDKDGIPTALLEAMASRLAIVATDSGSIREVVRDGVEALMVPQRDSRALAEAIDRISTDSTLERRLASAARQRFDQMFDSRVTEQPLHRRLRELLGTRS